MRCCIASSTTSRLKDQHNQGFAFGHELPTSPNEKRHGVCGMHRKSRMSGFDFIAFVRVTVRRSFVGPESTNSSGDAE